MIYLTIPNAAHTARFNARQSKLAFTYQPVFCTQTKTRPSGFDADEQRVHVGEGKQAFERAKKAIRSWQMFPKPWTLIQPQTAPIAEGEQVAMFARYFGLWWRNACRIVYVIDEQNRYGFAYGTTPGHIEKGEELFLVEMDENERVWYTIKAYSRPRHIFAIIGYPLMRMLQARFRKDSAAAMQRLINSDHA
jgi:uncharacterized protein (UPF0548 family)